MKPLLCVPAASRNSGQSRGVTGHWLRADLTVGVTAWEGQEFWALLLLGLESFFVNVMNWQCGPKGSYPLLFLFSE